MHTFSNVVTESVRFNRQGTRLLCREACQLPTVYEVPTNQQMTDGVNGNVRFSAPDYTTPNFGWNNFCFAGKDDESVVAASADHGLFVWSLPTDQQVAGEQIVDQPLVVLRGHKKDINAVRYNRQRDTLASAGADKIIRLWTPIARQQWISSISRNRQD